MKTFTQGFNTVAQGSNLVYRSREPEALPLSHCALRCEARVFVPHDPFKVPTTATLVQTQSLHFVEHNDSGVELWTLDYENPGSNSVLLCENLRQVFSLYIAPVHSAV